MKRLLLSIGFAVTTILGMAQTSMNEESKIKSSFAIGTGLNNTVGILGVQYEQRIGNYFSLYSGVGLGTWGAKVTLGTRIYKKGPLGSAFGVSFSSALGGDKQTRQMEVTDYSGITLKQQITYNALPVYLLNLSLIKFWQIGSKNRFSLEFGYSLNVSTPLNWNYEITTPSVILTEKTVTNMKQMQPGGMMLGIGFHFGS